MRLWDAISERAKLTGAYYIYSDELELLEEFGPEICAMLPEDITFIDLGIGSRKIIAEKLGVLFKALKGKVKHYIGVDAVPEVIAEARAAFAELYPDITFSSSLQDFYKDVPDLPTRRHSLAAVFGLTIPNIPVDPRIKGLPDAALKEMLKHLKGFVRPGERLLLTLDLNKNHQQIKTMYEEQKDIWMYLLHRIKKELNPSEDFDPEGFDFVVDFIEDTNMWVRKYVVNKPMSFRLGDQFFELNAGQEFFPHNAYKPTHMEFIHLAKQAGWQDAVSRKAANTNLALIALTA